jgi:hypothetical protein
MSNKKISGPRSIKTYDNTKNAKTHMLRLMSQGKNASTIGDERGSTVVVRPGTISQTAIEQAKKALAKRNKNITKSQQKTINQAAPVINRIVKGDKRKVTLAPKPEKPMIPKKGGGMIYKNMGGLVGGQTKLDMNKDGIITGQDFKMMPKKYGGKITYRMNGGKVTGAGYDD